MTRVQQLIGAHPGRYCQRVTIKRQADSQSIGSDGQLLETGATYASRWAKVAAVLGGERVLADQTVADVTHVVRMHSDSSTRAITPQMWLLMADGTRLDVVRVVDVQMREMEVLLLCKQRV